MGSLPSSSSPLTAYAGNGGGYCLGLRYSELRQMCWPEPKTGSSFPLLAKVHYGNTPKSIRTYLDAICAEVKPTKPGLESLLSRLSPFFPSMIKNEAFAEEHEWRIIVLDPPVQQMKFRSGNANIRPYVELSWLHLGKAKGVLPLVSIRS